jgi:pyridoxamine 5'-phosphate oxidase
MSDNIDDSFIWNELKKYAIPKNDFYTAVLSTLNLQKPGSRTVVIRSIDVINRKLTFYTDLRSDKICQIQSNPAIQLLFYHQKNQHQLILSGNAFIDSDRDQTLQIWQNLNRKDAYQSTLSPGTPVNSPIGHLIGSDDPMSGFENFTVVDCFIDEMESYHILSNEANSRILFSFENGIWDKTYLVP